MDPISGIGIGIQTLQALDFIRDRIAGSGVISAHFSGKGNWLGGSEAVTVKVETMEGYDGVWLYSVVPVDDYTFVHFALSESGIVEQLGYDDENLANADTRIWRWIAVPKPNTLVDGGYVPANALVEFIVVGYKLPALLNHFS